MADPETPESPKRLPFDEAVVAAFRDTIHAVLTDHPELRTVGIVFDWNGALNEAPIKAGLWVGENAGGVNEPAAIAGSIPQTMKLRVQQVSRRRDLEQARLTDLAIVGQSLGQKRQALIDLATAGKAPGGTSGEEES